MAHRFYSTISRPKCSCNLYVEDNERLAESNFRLTCILNVISMQFLPNQTQWSACHGTLSLLLTTKSSIQYIIISLLLWTYIEWNRFMTSWFGKSWFFIDLRLYDAWMMRVLFDFFYRFTWFGRFEEFDPSFHSPYEIHNLKYKKGSAFPEIFWLYHIIISGWWRW